MTLHDWTDGPPSAAVLHAVADEEGCDPSELPPLYEAIDPDALNEILEVEDDPDAGPRRIDFTYAGYDVTVTSDGTIDLTKH